MPAAVPDLIAASDSRERHADWLEIRALSTDDGNSSLQDLLSELRRTGSADALDDPARIGYRADAGAELTEPLAEDAIGEIDNRGKSCGSARYPFDVTATGVVQLRANGEDSLYAFLLLLSAYGKDAGPKKSNPIAIFEELCAAAAESYFGGKAQGARAHRFGFPRSSMPRGFAAALRLICTELGEGSLNATRHGLSSQKDGKLDVVAWKHFSDARRGKLVAFGQCATGTDWRSKTRELQPSDFIGKWMTDGPPVTPLRLFFIPDRIGDLEWTSIAWEAGILFDRCRIAEHLDDVPPALINRAAAWSRHVVSKRVRT